MALPVRRWRAVLAREPARPTERAQGRLTVQGQPASGLLRVMLPRPEHSAAVSHRAPLEQQAVRSPAVPEAARLMLAGMQPTARSMVPVPRLAEVPCAAQPQAVSQPEAAELVQLSAQQPVAAEAEAPSEPRQAAVGARPWVLPEAAGQPSVRREVAGAVAQLLGLRAAEAAQPSEPQQEAVVEAAVPGAVRQPEAAAEEVQPLAWQVVEVELPLAAPGAEAVQLSEVREAAVLPWAEPRPEAALWAAASACHRDQARVPARPAQAPLARCGAETRRT